MLGLIKLVLRALLHNMLVKKNILGSHINGDNGKSQDFIATNMDIEYLSDREH